MLLGNNTQSLYNMYMICVYVKLIFNVLNPLQRESKTHFASLCQRLWCSYQEAGHILKVGKS